MNDNTAHIEPDALSDAAQAIADAWRRHDKLALAGLTPVQRNAQVDAREALLDLVDDYRRAAEQEGEDVDHDPEWQVVAAMKDLLKDLHHTALYAGLDDDRHDRA